MHEVFESQTGPGSKQLKPRKRALSACDNTLSEIENPAIKRARRRALSGQQVQADSLTQKTKRNLSVLKIGDNVIIPVPSVDKAPTDVRNIRGVVLEVNEHGSYKVGTKVGKIKGYLSRNQFEALPNATLDVSDVPLNEGSVREIVSKLSLSGGQGHVHCNCKKDCKGGKCKCRKMKVMCNSRCHNSTTCSNK